MKKQWTDGEMLQVLDLRRKGMTARQIGDMFGVSKSAVIGLWDRINRDTDASEAA